MEMNMGMADRIVRPVFAAGFIGFYASGKVSGTEKILLGLSGIFVLTKFFGSCPVYQAVSINSITEGEVSA